MDNIFSTIKERILELAKNKGVKLEDFFPKIGMTYGSFKGSAKNRPLNSDAIANILTMWPDINAEWLIAGKGEMLKKNTSNTSGSGNLINTGVGGHAINIANSDYEKIIEGDRIELTRRGTESKEYLQEINRLKVEIQRLEAIIQSKNETIAAKDETISVLKNR